MEWLFVDGNSTDETIKIIEAYAVQYTELIRIISNPRRNVPSAMNLGIAASRGEYIIRLDAHVL